MHIRKYVKWKQVDGGSMLTNTKTGDWMSLNSNATFIFLQRFVNQNPPRTIAENLKMKYPEAELDVLLNDVNRTLAGFEESVFFSLDENDRGFINLIIPPHYLDTLNIKITNDCNLKCKHCLEAKREIKKGLTFEQIAKLIDDASCLGANEIVLTGGEPFMRDDIVKIIELIDSLQMKTTIFTNGTIIPDSFFTDVKGMNVFIRVSLEGAAPEINDAIRGAGSFSATISTMKRCNENGIPFGVAITVNALNFSTYKDVIMLAHQYHAVEIEASDVINMGNASDNQHLLLSEDQLVQLRIEMLALMVNNSALRRGMGMNRPEYSLNVHSKNSRLLRKCCNAGISSCVVDTNGDVYPCLMFVDEIEYNCGNVNAMPFRDIWWECSVLDIFRNLHIGDVSTCATCDLVEECAGGCRAIAYAKTKDILAPVDETYCNVTRRALEIFKRTELAEQVRMVQERILSNDNEGNG